MEIENLLSKLRVPEWEIQDPTKVMEYIRCPRKYFYGYVLGWRPTMPNNHLVFGSAVHKAMEHILLNGYSVNEVLRAHEKFLHYYREHFPEDTDEMFFPKTPDNFLVVLTAYTRKYERDLDSFKVLYTEIAGTISLRDDLSLAFRMDSILENLKGLRSSLEHKTGSSSWNWEMQWDLSIQVGTYTHVLNCLFDLESVEGVRMNGLIFGKAKKGWEQLKTGQSLTVNPPFDFIRYPAFKSKTQMQTWLYTVTYYLDMIKFEFEQLLHCRFDDPVMFAFPMRHVACTDFGGCPWHDFCISFQNPLQRSEEPPLGYEVSHWNPLKEEATTRFELKG